ncbi:MAG: LLM class flavin-dependent oxidoreductase [Thaumarchaeota archaeon]|nr:LLM class flavin-dependent oxidoreductase [Nitrososphaerota archaeon]
MRFGVRLPQDGPFASAKNMIRVAKEAETLGFSHVWVNDHISWSTHEKYHLGAGTKEAVDKASREQILVKYDSLTTLAAISGICPNIKVGTACLVLPLRAPLALAKAAVSLRELSEGRFIMGVCAGNIEEEATLHHYDYNERGKIMDEALQIITEALHTGEVHNYRGKYYQYEEAYLYPKPSKHIPLWYGGRLPTGEVTSATPLAALRRTAKYCDALFPGLYSTPDAFRKVQPRLEDYCRKYNRDPKTVGKAIETFACITRTDEEALSMTRPTMKERSIDPLDSWVFLGSPSTVTEKFEAYKPMRVEDFELKFVVPTLEEMLTQMRRFAAEVIPSLP